MVSKKVAVIGAGLGGLSAAARLASSGYDVTVFEKNSTPGGKANQIEKNGFRFDTGPSLLTMAFVIEQLFSDLGENINEYLQLKKLETICKYFWEDGTSINAFSRKESFAQEIENKTTDDAGSVLTYLDYTAAIYDLTAELFLFNDFSDWKSLFNKRGLRTLLQIWKIDPFRTMHKANSAFFKDKKTVQLFDRYATYNGSSPYKAPATLNIIPHVEYNLGGFVPAKGIYSLVEALFSLAQKKGAQFAFNTEINKIIVENGRACGVKYLRNGRDSGSKFDFIISNADVNFTVANLLDNVSHAKKTKQNEPSTSALVFYWGIKGIRPGLDIHNIIFSSNYEKEFYELFEERVCPTEPTIYIYISSKYNKNDAPEGCENWFVMINAPANRNLNWNEDVPKLRNLILQRIRKVLGIELQEKIMTESILTPVEIERKTSSYLGSLYGISSNNKSAAFLRPKNKSSHVSGLYYCGGSAHPGGGIPLVLLSGKITAEQIIKDRKND